MPQWQAQKDLGAWQDIVEWIAALKPADNESAKGPLRVGLGGAVRLVSNRSSA
jgi:hypothetical protein